MPRYRSGATAPSGAVQTWAAGLCFFTALGASSAIAQDCPAGATLAPLAYDTDRLTAARSRLADGDARLRPAYAALIARADAALGAPLRSVMDKPRSGDSGDSHDYVSLAPYWWPDQKSEDGRPYVRRDGQVNPERDGDGFDRRRFQRMMDDVTDLSLAAVLSGDARYAGKADAALKAWFLDPETRMNPHFAYAQQVPGRTNGRAIGIIDAHGLPRMADAALLLSNASLLPDETMDGLRQWLGAYAAWLITSDFGQEERAAKNNHGTHYDAQLASYLILGGRCDLAARVLDDAKTRVRGQIQPDGVMPLEADRTRSLHYHSFNAEAFLRLAMIADLLGDDLYAYKAEGAGSVADTIAMLASYAGQEDRWPFERLDEKGTRSLWRLLMRTRLLRDDPAIEEALHRMEGWPDHELVLTTGQGPQD